LLLLKRLALLLILPRRLFLDGFGVFLGGSIDGLGGLLAVLLLLARVLPLAVIFDELSLPLFLLPSRGRIGLPRRLDCWGGGFYLLSGLLLSAQDGLDLRVRLDLDILNALLFLLLGVHSLGLEG
jgi:hypothetical protein